MATKEEQISQGIQGAVQVFRRVDKIPIGKRTKKEFKWLDTSELETVNRDLLIFRVCKLQISSFQFCIKPKNLQTLKSKWESLRTVSSLNTCNGDRLSGITGQQKKWSRPGGRSIIARRGWFWWTKRHRDWGAIIVSATQRKAGKKHTTRWPRVPKWDGKNGPNCWRLHYELPSKVRMWAKERTSLEIGKLGRWFRLALNQN